MIENPAILDIIAKISGDKSDGATSLALRGLDALELLSSTIPEDCEDPRSVILELTAKIDSLRPSMAAIGVQAILASNRAFSFIGEGMSPGPALRRAVNTEREILGQANATIAGLAARELGTGGTLISCSWSVTAMRAVVALEPEKVFLGEGHRLGDGLRAAKWLAARGLEVVVVPDGALPTVVPLGRVVLVGADQVLSDGSVINRCSTLSLALAARYSGVPLVVACQRIKLCGREEARIEEGGNLFGDLPRGVTAQVPLFDLTPARLVDSILTESGRLTAGEAGAVGAGIATLRARLLEL